MLRRLALVVLVLSLGHLSVVLGLAQRAPRGPTLMPAAGGPLTELAIQFHRPDGALFLPVYRQLFAALSPDTRVTVVVADADDEATFTAAREAWFPDGGGPSVGVARVGRPITSWARDRLAVLTHGDDTVLLAPPAPMPGPAARISDWTVPWTLADALGDGFRVQKAPFQLEGGDLIADEARVYVAAPLWGRNPDLSVWEVLERVERTLGRPVVALGADGTPVPDHHIGMFLTPLGGGRVAVGDPQVGRALLPEGTLEVGGRSFEPETAPDVLDRFAAVAESLEAEGLTVVRLPLVPSRTPYAWLTYNNVLLEHRDGALQVYMPTYGVPALDAAAADVWLGEGAVVHPIDVAELFWRGGSVRCVTAALARG